MASIPGSHFALTSMPSSGINVVETSDGNLPAPVAGQFNLAVWTGPGAPPAGLAPGYDAVAVLSPNGQQFELVTNNVSFRETVPGSGQDTVTISGDNDTLTVVGNDSIDVMGNSNTVHTGSGHDTISVYGNNNSIDLGTGRDQLNIFGHNTSFTDSSNDTINVLGHTDLVFNDSGSNNTINFQPDAQTLNASGSTGNNILNISGAHDTVYAGGGQDTVNVNAANDDVHGSTGNTLFNISGINTTVQGGSGNDTINLYSFGDTVASSGGHDLINMVSGGATFAAGHQGYTDTVVGFSAASDTIKLAAGDDANALVATQQQQNGGQDTLITLSDGSTILFKGIGHVSAGFFS